MAVKVVAAAASHALQQQQTQINAQAEAVAAAQQQQLIVNQQFAATNHASIAADAVLQRQMQDASDAHAASGAAAAVWEQKVAA